MNPSVLPKNIHNQASAFQSVVPALNSILPYSNGLSSSAEPSRMSLKLEKVMSQLQGSLNTESQCKNLDKNDSTHHSVDSESQGTAAGSPGLKIEKPKARLHSQEDGPASDSSMAKREIAMLSDEQKKKRCSDYAKHIKQLRRKVRAAEERLRNCRKIVEAESSETCQKFSQAHEVLRQNSMNPSSLGDS